MGAFVDPNDPRKMIVVFVHEISWNTGITRLKGGTGSYSTNTHKHKHTKNI